MTDGLQQEGGRAKECAERRGSNRDTPPAERLRDPWQLFTKKLDGYLVKCERRGWELPNLWFSERGHGTKGTKGMSAGRVSWCGLNCSERLHWTPLQALRANVHNWNYQQHFVTIVCELVDMHSVNLAEYWVRCYNKWIPIPCLAAAPTV